MHLHALRSIVFPMSTNLQIRSVDETLAAAAKAEAARRHLSLSDYLKQLIQDDLDAQSAAARRAQLYAEIATNPPLSAVTAEDTSAALQQARQEMGLS